MKTAGRHMVAGTLAKDDGFAMIAVVGVLAVITILVVSAAVLSQQALLDVQRASKTQLAFEAADAGYNAVWSLLNSTSAPVPDHGEWTGTVPTTRVTYSVIESQTAGAPTPTYLLTSTAATGGVSQTVSMQFTQESVPDTGGFWDKTVLSGNWNSTKANFWGPMYTDLPVSGTLFNPNSVNPLPVSIQPTDALNALWVNNGVVATKVLPFVNPSEQTSPTLYVNGTLSGGPGAWQTMGFRGPPKTFTPLPMPRLPSPADLKACAEATGYAFTGALTFPTGTRSTDSIGPFYVGSTNTTSFYWDAPNQTLTLNGIIYVPGTIDFKDVDISYQGRGTLVCDGNVNNGKVDNMKYFLPKNGRVTRMNSATYGWSPLSANECAGVMYLVPGGRSDLKWFNIDCGTSDTGNTDYRGNFQVAAAIYCQGKIGFPQGSGNRPRLIGGVFANCIDNAGKTVDVVVDPKLTSYLPPGLPGAVASQKYSLKLISKTWSRQ